MSKRVRSGWARRGARGGAGRGVSGAQPRAVTHRGRTRAPSVTAGEPSHSEAAFRCRGSQLPGRLFVERAAATMNEFELTDADAAIVAEICENWTEFRLRSSLQQPASRSPSTTTWSRPSRRIEPRQCQGKWPDRPLDHRSGCPRVPVAVRTSRLSSREEGKAIIFTPVRESSGESQLRSCRRSRSDALARRTCRSYHLPVLGRGGVRDRRQYRDQWRPAHAIAGTLKA